MIICSPMVLMVLISYVSSVTFFFIYTGFYVFLFKDPLFSFTWFLHVFHLPGFAFFFSQAPFFNYMVFTGLQA